MKLMPSGLVRVIARQVLITKKNSPHIFFVAGLGGSIVSTVMACKATLKLDETLEEVKKDIQDVKNAHADTSIRQQDGQYARDMAAMYGRTVSRVGKLYGPSVLVGVASMGALTGSHVQLARRNSALTATVVAVTKAFDEYRDRVRDEYGQEKELDIYRGVRNEKIPGQKELVKVKNGPGGSPYSRLFDAANSTAWVKHPEYNAMFLRANQAYMNDRLRSRGHVLLNDVFDSLGMERTDIGSIVGWVREGEGDGDGYIDFGLFEAYNQDFLNGHEQNVWLDFNVDGVVNHLIGRQK